MQISVIGFNIRKIFGKYLCVRLDIGVCVRVASTLYIFHIIANGPAAAA